MNGFVNLGFLIFFSTHARLLLENLLRHGVRLKMPTQDHIAQLAAMAAHQGVALGAGVLLFCVLVAWSNERWALRYVSDHSHAMHTR